MFLDENNKFMDLREVRDISRKNWNISSKANWPKEEVYNAYKAMPNADSVTVDCHKLGYVPYPCAAVVFKDKRIMGLIAFHAAYVEDTEPDAVIDIGAYIMEGSKPGAAAAAAWTAHKVVPLNINGYGQILGRTVKTANDFYNSLNNLKPFKADNGKTYIVTTVYNPDLNIVDYAFKEAGNNSLSDMNKLNKKIYNECSYHGGELFYRDFITSKTVFNTEEYGNAPKTFITNCGFSSDEWNKVGEVFILRSVIMTPFLSNNDYYKDYWNKFVRIMKKVIGKV